MGSGTNNKVYELLCISKDLKMNDGIRSSGLVSISTTTFSDVDILFTKCLRFAPQTGELLQNSYFFAKTTFCTSKNI